MKRTFCIAWAIVALTLASATAGAKTVRITSPGGRLTVNLQTDKRLLGWTVDCDGQTVFTTTGIRLTVGDRVLGGETSPKSVKTTQVSETLRPVVPLKRSVIESRYTLAALNFGQYQLELRVMDNAAAWQPRRASRQSPTPPVPWAN